MHLVRGRFGGPDTSSIRCPACGVAVNGELSRSDDMGLPLVLWVADCPAHGEFEVAFTEGRQYVKAEAQKGHPISPSFQDLKDD